jgi:hypothetical protein
MTSAQVKNSKVMENFKMLVFHRIMWRRRWRRKEVASEGGGVGRRWRRKEVASEETEHVGAPDKQGGQNSEYLATYARSARG